jgi:hypothetical protein
LNELNAQLDKHGFYRAFPVLSRGRELVLHDPARHGHRQLRRPLFNWAKRARLRPITGHAGNRGQNNRCENPARLSHLRARQAGRRKNFFKEIRTILEMMQALTLPR